MRWVRRVLVGLMILILGIAVYGFFTVRSSFPQIEGEVVAAGLDDEVEVIRDVEGVPHIYAGTSHDLFFAQGYVHAQDRFWQMDFWRHIGSARLSEMFGDGQVETDLFLRSLDFTGLAEQEYEGMPDEYREILDAYAAGVNAYLEGRSPASISLEYAILPLQASGYEIEPWTPINTLTWGKVMSWDLGANLLQEIARADLSAVLSPDRIAQLYPEYPDDHPVIVTADPASTTGEAPPRVPSAAIAALSDIAESAEALRKLTGGGFAGIGSNNWVVAGSHTESGMPLLANDPHLAIQMPSIWYQNGLHCAGDGPECPYQVVGFSFAGTPGVILGHNESIAWGVTNAALDTQDLFIEKVNPDNPAQYEFEGEWVDMATRTETISVAGGEDISHEVMSTHHGPIISDTYFEEPPFQGSDLELPQGFAVSLAWQTLEPSTLVEAIIDLDRATTYEEFESALSKWDIAGQNVVYADAAGNIAYQATGEVPVRAGGDGTRPVPGWTGEYEWTGTVPPVEMPGLFNPPAGFIATANNPVLPVGSQPFLTSDSDHGHRAARIEELIEATGAHTVASAQAIQMDSRDGGAAGLVPFLLEFSSELPEVVALQQVIEPWSQGADAFQAGPDSPGAAAYQAVWVNLLRLVFHDEMPEDYWPEGGSRWFLNVASLLETPDDPFWDDIGTDQVEDRDVILEQAMVAAHDDLAALIGDDPASWRWGDLHVGRFENQTFGQSGIAPIEWLFNRTAPRRLGGGADLVNAVGFYPPDGYQVDWVPSMRMVIDLGDLDASTWVNTTGQSGHAFHRHYDDMLEPWADGAQHPMRWARDQIEQAAEGALVLLPAS